MAVDTIDIAMVMVVLARPILQEGEMEAQHITTMDPQVALKLIKQRPTMEVVTPNSRILAIIIGKEVPICISQNLN